MIEELKIKLDREITFMTNFNGKSYKDREPLTNYTYFIQDKGAVSHEQYKELIAYYNKRLDGMTLSHSFIEAPSKKETTPFSFAEDVVVNLKERKETIIRATVDERMVRKHALNCLVSFENVGSIFSITGMATLLIACISFPILRTLGYNVDILNLLFGVASIGAILLILLTLKDDMWVGEIKEWIWLGEED